MSGRKWFLVLFSIGVLYYFGALVITGRHADMPELVIMPILGGLMSALVLSILIGGLGSRIMMWTGHERLVPGGSGKVADYLNFFFGTAIRKHPDVVLGTILGPILCLALWTMTQNLWLTIVVTVATGGVLETAWVVMRRGRYRPNRYVTCPFCRSEGFWAVPSRARQRYGAEYSVMKHRHFRCERCKFDGRLGLEQHPGEAAAALQEFERSWPAGRSPN